VKEINLEVEAEKLATYEHRNQFRDDGNTPYIEHPKRVVTLLKIYGFVTDPEVLAVGWLHDVLEDTMVSPQTIKELFGRNVAFGVSLMTKITKDRWEVVENLNRHRNSRFVVVKLADRLSNLEDMKSWDEDRKRSYAIGALGILWAVPRKTAPTLWDALLDKAYQVLIPEVAYSKAIRTVFGLPKDEPVVQPTFWRRIKRFIKKCWRNL
jgi:GTP pyrophosphokinase